MDLITKDELKAKIITIRGMQVMLDRDLAELYNVETKRIIKSYERTEQLLIEIMEEENQSIYKKQKNTKNDPQRKAHLGHYILLIISPLIVFFILSISSYLHIPLILFFLGAILTIASLLLNWLNNR
jgi:ABC-type multidrug transport system fused ATPase/permease subunit